MKHIKYLALAAAVLLAVAPAGAAKKDKAPRGYYIDLPTRAEGISNRYGNLDYGLRINVRSNVHESEVVDTKELPSADAKKFPEVSFENTIPESSQQYLYSMSRDLGFKTSTGGSDFTLRVTIKDLRLAVRDYNTKKKVYSTSGTAVISWELVNSENEVVIAATSCTGHKTSRDFNTLLTPVGKALEQALNAIDWDAIASQLKIAKSARQEGNKQVTGKGDSALEHTVIRWYIESKPQGADVSWRVVSSTPDVANTNANFVGSTPYESTESFDIKGLTYNNSGNVQIEVTCERDGYLTQKKRFNLRQVIDQKEISAKFKLIKEDEE